MRTDTDIMMKNYYEKFKAIFNVSYGEMYRLIMEDNYLGWEDVGHTHAGGRRELKALYCAIRLSKPKSVLEIGTYKGDSTNHILLAAEKNTEEGHPCKVTTIDITEYLDKELHPFEFTRMIGNSLDVIEDGDWDFVFQDGNHNPNHVKKELQLLMGNPSVKTIFAHDCFLYPKIGELYEVKQHKLKSLTFFKESKYKAGFLIAQK